MGLLLSDFVNNVVSFVFADMPLFGLFKELAEHTRDRRSGRRASIASSGDAEPGITLMVSKLTSWVNMDFSG